MARTTVPDRSALAREWRVLCDHLGERRAGSAAERRAAEFMAGRFAELGLPRFVAEELPCPSLARARRRLAAQIGGRWQHHSRPDFPANVSVGAVLRLVQAVAPLVQDLAGRRAWPFARALPPAQARKVKRLADELFDF